MSIASTVRPVDLRLTLPDELRIAPYADVAMVSHNEHGFSVDFAALGGLGLDGSVDGTLVARVKVPPSVIFQIAAAIAENVDIYEQRYGKITPPPPEGS